MKAKVIENVCIGCGACCALVPEEFELQDTGVAKAISEVVKEELEDDVKTAADNCPTGAISVSE